MRIIYRLCGIASTNPSPIYQDNKFKLNELCLRSFINAFQDVDPKVTVLMDYCGPEYSKLIDLLPFETDIETSTSGINQTMLRSYELASKEDDFVLFQECDYLYNGVIGKKLQEASKLGIVSPYNHPNFYKDRNLHSNECKVELVDNVHWRSTERNTMTWGCHSDVVKKYRQIFDRHGYLDGQVWYDLKSEGVELWVPIPSFATHMVESALAPSINWEEIWKTLIY